MRCLETRATAEGWRRRRYEDESGRRWTTLELPIEVLRSVGMGRLHECSRAHQRGVEQRERARQLREEVARRDGWKVAAIAHDLGVTEMRVRQIRAEMAVMKEKHGQS